LIGLRAYLKDSNDMTIMVIWGQNGYFPVAENVDVDMMNKEVLNLTPEQVDAMKAGSMFGWDIPAVTNVFGK